ncbi:MAG TPA: hypothetical protein VFK01_06615, partial [Bradyrhizobium sp.]|nr:hypothetical protein [Bradyrhizobium sp.]
LAAAQRGKSLEPRNCQRGGLSNLPASRHISRKNLVDEIFRDLVIPNERNPKRNTLTWVVRTHLHGAA